MYLSGENTVKAPLLSPRYLCEQNEKAVTGCQLTDYPLNDLLANVFGTAVIRALKSLCLYVGTIFFKATLVQTYVNVVSHLPLEVCTSHFSHVSVQWNYRTVGLVLDYTDSYLLQTAPGLCLSLRWH